MDLETIVWTLGFIASLIAIISLIAAIIKWSKKKAPNNNPITPSRVRPKGLISNNLPSLESIGNLVGEGRRRKQLEILEAIQQHRVVVLEGIGGIGKSTLARNVAEQIVKNKGKKYNAVVWISAKDTEVNLDSALKTIAYVLDYHQYISMLETVGLKTTAIIEKLQEKNVFFVFDNFETIIDNELRKFIQIIPDNNRILVTTRHGVEKISQDQFLPEIEKLDFIDGKDVILHELKKQGLIKHSTDDVVKKIYEFTDGLPQAIIWAISQLKYSTISSIETVALSGQGDVFENLFKQSWSMLDNPHKEILKAMLFFTKPVASKALKSATNLLDREFNDAMLKLVGLSIIDANQEIDEETKFYSMHSWSRHFSRINLNYNNGDTIFTAKNIGKYYVSFCEERYGKKKGLDDMEYELPNMLKTFQLLEKSENTKESNILINNFAKTINIFLWSQGFWSERIFVCNMGLAAAEHLINSANTNEQGHYYGEAGKHSYYIGIVNFWQGKYELAEKWAEISLAFMEKSNSKLNLMLANRLFALISMSRGDEKASDKFIEVLDVLRDYRDINQESVALFADWIVLGEKGYLVGEVSLLQEVGICYYRQKKFEEAKKPLLESKKLALEINDEEGMAVSLSHLGHVYYGLEDYSSAIQCYTQGLSLAEKVRRKSTIARCCEGLTKIYDKRNRIKKIERYGLAALDLFEKLNMTKEYTDISIIMNNRNIKLINHFKNKKNMKVIKKSNETFVREDAHGGSGGRKLLLADNEMKNVQGMTYGFLPAGSKFAWHNHDKLNEVMYVLKGQGTVRDEDGIYPYTVGDVFIFPEGIYHEIENTSMEEHEYIFVRVYL